MYIHACIKYAWDLLWFKRKRFCCYICFPTVCSFPFPFLVLRHPRWAFQIDCEYVSLFWNWLKPRSAWLCLQYSSPENRYELSPHSSSEFFNVLLKVLRSYTLVWSLIRWTCPILSGLDSKFSDWRCHWKDFATRDIVNDNFLRKR